MDMITVTAKTVDEAVTKALIELETTSDKLEYEVVEKGSAGFLGIGAKPAIIRAKKKETLEDRAIDFLSQVFDAMNLDVKIAAAFNEEEGEMNIDLSGEDMGILIGKRGQTLDSLQYLVGFLMFGNLIRECGVLPALSQTAQNELANLITLLLGITISFSMRADAFVRVDTLLIMGIGLIAFIFDTIGGVLFAKFMNLFLKTKINPMIGAAGISAFPMSSRVVQKLAMEEEKGNIILMHAVGANVSGQIASVIAGGLVIKLVSQYL